MNIPTLLESVQELRTALERVLAADETQADVARMTAFQTLSNTAHWTADTPPEHSRNSRNADHQATTKELWVLAMIREVLKVGHKPMLTELPYLVGQVVKERNELRDRLSVPKSLVHDRLFPDEYRITP